MGDVDVVLLKQCRRWQELAKVASATAFLASSLAPLHGLTSVWVDCIELLLSAFYVKP